MVMLADSSRSINPAGTGAKITRILATMPIGSIRFWIRAQGPGAAGRGTLPKTSVAPCDKEREGTENRPGCPGRFENGLSE